MKTRILNSITWLVLISIICICLDIMYDQSAQISQQQREINRLEVEAVNWKTVYKLSDNN